MSYRGHRDPKIFERAWRLLKQIPAGSAPAELFHALRLCAPVAGGLIGTMGSGKVGSMISHVVELPSYVFEGWAATPLEDLRLMLRPLIPAKPGDLISDRKAITGPFRENLRLLKVLDSAGLGESAGYKVAVRTGPSGKREHSFLTVALEDRAAFTPAQREMFRRLHPMIEAALARMALPFIPHLPLMPQVVQEQRIGYLCLSKSRSVIELNGRAHELAYQYSQAAGVQAGRRGWLSQFAERILSQTKGGQTWHLVRQDYQASVLIDVHRLSRKHHPINQDVALVMLREIEVSPALLSLSSGAPKPWPCEVAHLMQKTKIRFRCQAPKHTRRCVVAHLLTTTSLQYKEIADQLGIKKRTVDKHVEKVYRAFRVNGRPALTERLSRLR